jgi:diacylglycerol kinase family enzyme
MVVAGGDGTCHEVVNGLLARADKKKIPLAFLPNGSGDDFCSAVGIMSMDHGLDYICKAETIKVDTIRVLLDHDSEDTLPEGIERFNFCRHSIINAGCAMPPLIAFKAKAWKTCCGKTSYTIATLIEAIKGNIIPEIFEVHVDGEKFSTD